MNDATAYRLRLHASGYQPIPCCGKNPGIAKDRPWQTLGSADPEEIKRWGRDYPDARNTGILTRLTPVFDTDILHHEAAAAVERLIRDDMCFEERGTLLVRFGLRPKRAILFRTNEPGFKKITRTLRAPNGGEQRLEILADGQQLIVAGVHPDTGKPYTWLGDVCPGAIAYDELPYLHEYEARDLISAAAALLINDFGFTDNKPPKSEHVWPRQSHRPGDGQRYAQAALERECAALANTGSGGRNAALNTAALKLFELVAADALTDDQVEAALIRACEANGLIADDGIRSVQATIRSGARKGLTQPRAIPQRPTHYHEEFVPDQLVEHTGILCVAEAADSATFIGPEVKICGALVASEAPDCAAVVVLFTAAKLFDPWQRFIVPEFPLHVLPQVVQAYVQSQSMVIGCDPAALAMAALTAFSGALDHRFAVKMMRSGNWWERPRLWTLLVGDPSRKKTPIINDVIRPLERHQNDLRRDYETRLRDYEAAKEDKDDSVEKPDPPVRYVVWDTTTEKLGEILSRSEHGLLVKRDEFSGWIGGMEKYSGGSRSANADRGFWLQAYDGGPHTVDRIGRGETYIGNLSVSLIGGIQPAKLAELRGLTSDGLLQRFLPVMMRASTLPQDCEGDDWENYHRLVYKLIRAKHQRLFLSDRALQLMNDLRAHLHKLEQAAGGLADGLQAFIGKLAGVAGRLALILHMVANPESTARQIEAETVANVRILIFDFILPHAVEFYRSTEELTGGERLRKIASWIVTGQQKTITSRDLVRNVACLRMVSVFDLQTLVSPLVAAGWLKPAQQGPLNRTWTVSPIVAAQFERQRQIEEERKILVAELMGSSRKSAAKMSTS